MNAARFFPFAPGSLLWKSLAWTLLIGVLTGLPASAQAQCTPAQIRQMIQQGLSDAEIDRRCTADTSLPPWLAGTWEITMQEQQTTVPTPMGFGATVAYWQIVVDDTELRVQRIKDAHLPEQYHRFESLSVRDVHVADTTLSFTVHDRAIPIPSTTRLQINLQSPDVLQGRYVQTSAGVMGLPPHQSVGTVSMRRVDLHLQPGSPAALRSLPARPLPRDWASTFCMPNCD